MRGQDLNLRPSGYEPDELPDCSTPRHEIHFRTQVLAHRRPSGKWTNTQVTGNIMGSALPLPHCSYKKPVCHFKPTPNALCKLVLVRQITALIVSIPYDKAHTRGRRPQWAYEQLSERRLPTSYINTSWPTVHQHLPPKPPPSLLSESDYCSTLLKWGLLESRLTFLDETS